MNTNNVLFVSTTKFKNKSKVNLNVEDQEIATSIYNVQEMYIQPIWGEAMYNSALTYKYGLLTNTAHTHDTNLDNLFDASEDAIIWCAVCDLTTESIYKMTNLGLSKKGATNDTTVDISELKFLLAERQKYKNFYLESLNNFLLIRSTTYSPYQTTSTTQGIYADNTTKYESAFATRKSFIRQSPDAYYNSSKRYDERFGV